MRTDLIKWILLLLTFFGLASCSSLSPRQQPTPEASPTWENRVGVLSDFQTWDLKGLIAIRNSRDAWSANWQWSQHQKDYTIGLFGPMGSHSIQLTGSPHSVLLETSDGKKFQSTSPESLLEQQLGWRLPVSDLYYWIRGLPVPSLPAEKKWDASHRFDYACSARMENRIFERYANFHHMELPSKMLLDNGTLNVKILINEWQ